MMIGSLVRFANKPSVNGTFGTWVPNSVLTGDGTWSHSSTTGRNHRKAIVMRDDEFYEIALKHLEQVSKTSIERKKNKKDNTDK